MVEKAKLTHFLFRFLIIINWVDKERQKQKENDENTEIIAIKDPSV